MDKMNNIDDINNMSTDCAEFIQECFNMKLFNYQKTILNAMEKCNHRDILVWMPSRDSRKSLFSYYLMEKWFENKSENRLENKLESDTYAESEQE